ncbi:MAG: dihydroorotate dehydrogenase electron transfer subunit [Solirubrobacterales bacterium]
MSGSALERPQALFGTRLAHVTARREAGPYVALTALDRGGPEPIAGQFYMLRTPERWGGGEDGRPYLPRALSFARAVQTADGVELDFLFEAVGPGTARLSDVAPGEELVLTGPFGNGFALDAERWPVLVAGGIGLAPIVALDDELRLLDGVRSTAFVGMRSAEHASAAGLYELDHSLATDDGSSGHHGFVTELLAGHLDEQPESTVYACGPPGMLESVRALCEARDVPSQLALESGMACGFGACFGCVVPTKSGYLRLCVDGPVLAGDVLDTAITPGPH